MRTVFGIAAFVILAAASQAEEIRLATYNVEYFNSHFLAHQLATSSVASTSEGKAMLGELAKKNDEDNWETAEVILDPNFNPDILVIEEGCEQADLEYFNHRWLHDGYKTVKQFPGNSDRHQNVCMLLKDGFQVLEQRDKYYLEPDPVGNERGARLFARGPVFLKVKSPGGYEFWVGGTHMKSKSMGNPATAGPAAGKPNATPASEVGAGSSSDETSESRARKVDVTKWRNREATRTHEIIKELEKAGPSDVILLGDMNDSIGLDPYEGDGGGDGVMNLVGPPEDGLTLVTKRIAKPGEFSFHGYWRTAFRELIDHIIVTKSMDDQVGEVKIVKDGLAKVASDHFPVMVKITSK